MKKAALVVPGPYRSNKVFDLTDVKLNRDNCLIPFTGLRNELLKLGIELNTQDINSESESDIVIYNEMPSKLPPISQKNKNFLLIMESPLIIKNSWDSERLERFKKVFSWNDDIVDGKRFIKVNYTFEIPQKINIVNKRPRLCTLISSHKLSDDKNELYTERIKTIRWFEKNAPQDFDLYGMGWDRPAYIGWKKIFKKMPLVKDIMPFSEFPSYKGIVENKKKVLEEYKFSICYENIKDLNGYITEKIFDSFFAGTIPIYWGAKNICDYIPGNTFINRAKYQSIEELYSDIKTMSDDRYQEYRDNIQNFLKSDSVQQFDYKTFGRIVAAEISKDI